MNKMEESTFNVLIDETLSNIEDAIGATNAPIDYEINQGILTLEFPDNSKIIINRQTATRELWIAAKSGGYHLTYYNSSWICNKTQEGLSQLLSRLCSEQLHERFQLNL